MKRYPLLFTTFLTSCLVLQQASIGVAADTITMGTAQTGTETITPASIGDPRVAAANFVEHVNFARVALAMRNVDLASSTSPRPVIWRPSLKIPPLINNGFRI